MFKAYFVIISPCENKGFVYYAMILRLWLELGVRAFIIVLFLISKDTIGASKKFEFESWVNLNESKATERYWDDEPQWTTGLVLVKIRVC